MVVHVAGCGRDWLACLINTTNSSFLLLQLLVGFPSGCKMSKACMLKTSSSDQAWSLSHACFKTIMPYVTFTGFKPVQWKLYVQLGHWNVFFAVSMLFATSKKYAKLDAIAPFPSKIYMANVFQTSLQSRHELKLVSRSIDPRISQLAFG